MYTTKTAHSKNAKNSKKIQKKRGSFVKKNFHSKLQKKSQKVTARCDYMKLQIISRSFFSFCHYLQLINDTNTNYVNIGITSDTIDNTQIINTQNNAKESSYEILVTTDLGTYPVAKLKEYKGSDCFISEKNKGTLHLYGAFFRLQEIGYIDYDFFDMIELYDIQDQIITRYDYKLDYWGCDDIPKTSTIYKQHKGKRTFYNGEDKSQATGWQIGRTKSGKSRQCFIRCYDKKQDIQDKNKGMLYNDYIGYESNIYRLEFEFGDKFCKARGEITLGEIDKIEKQIQEYLGFCPKTDVFSTPKYRLQIQLANMDQVAKTKYIKNTMSRVSTLAQNGYSLLHLCDMYDIPTDTPNYKELQTAHHPD